ncbi:DUF3304 domain-containing protein [Pseudomonas sp. TMW22091]|uniref:DUF3304 domain-containing protein n=1 Tax=Pseudomonas sp. TMW22091 TaxID=2506435 RepID=UPI001F0EBD12|nr:DUF3304 domain-containing protein [Pseudomonas sp. TMW22091]
MPDTMICRVYLLLAASLLLQGCVESRPTMLGASISGVNHTSAAINHFSVNGGGGPNIGPYGGGPGSQMCCAMLPVQWREGLTVVVEWEKDPNVGASVNWPPLGTDGYRVAYKEHAAKYTRHRAVVEVAPYKQLGLVTVHFLPCDQVKVSASPTYEGLSGHPYNFPRRMEVPSTCPTP